LPLLSDKKLLIACSFTETEETKGSGPVDLWYNERLRKEKKMGSSDENMFDGTRIIKLISVQYTNKSFVLDILLPIFIVSALFILNAVVFVIIIRYRKRQNRDEFDKELADL
jgi:hypothetical protein